MIPKRVWSGSPWEERAGYCRAIRVGDRIWISGTAPFGEEGEVVATGDLAGQTSRCLQIIAEALAELGAKPADVVITRMFVTDIARAAELSGPHREMFGGHPPASTLVEVAALVHPDILIEIEVEAVVSDD